ncbi:MAG: hypothetical protein Ta2E_03320 [Mycoplasmoidaceae bacterium]|nr:MAG: hypothetical protein Ta2E_03320 [Mycoplasmoidaceae bacterium]
MVNVLNKKSKILWSMLFTGTTILAAGGGVIAGYILFNKKQDTITFEGHDASLVFVNNARTRVKAISSLGREITYTTSSEGKDVNWKVEDDYLKYLSEVQNKITVTITAMDGITENKIEIDLLPADSTSPTVVAYNDVNYSGYVQSKNSSKTLTVVVAAHNYILTNSNKNELQLAPATNNDQSDKLQVDAGVLDTTDNKMIYTISIIPSQLSVDITNGNFALKLISSNASISMQWESGDISIYPDTIDYHIIDQNVPSEYLINNGDQIFTSSTPITSHNKLLNLEKYVTDHNIKNGSYDAITIKDEVDFGILVGLNQSVQVHGDNGNIKLLSQNSTTYGIVVGSTISSPSGQYIYTGDMIIDDSLNVNISSSSSAYGVAFNSVAPTSTISIAGTFDISSADPYINPSSNYSTGATGVYFALASKGTITISGTFTISLEYGASSSSSANGVWIFSLYSCSLTISGIFNISSEKNSCGVYFYNGLASDGSLNISGVFTISSNQDLFGVYFRADTYASISIPGTFTIVSNSGSSAFGVYFNSNDRNIVNISGVFTLSSGSTAYGIKFYGYDTNTVRMINATFAIYDTINDVVGVQYSEGASKVGIPTFYSNQDEGYTGDWRGNPSDNHYYQYWNGDLSNYITTPTVADTNLTLESIYDVGNSQYNSNFYIMRIATVGGSFSSNLQAYNDKYKDNLQAAINLLPSSSTGVAWLKSIINTNWY